MEYRITNQKDAKVNDADRLELAALRSNSVIPSASERSSMKATNPARYTLHTKAKNKYGNHRVFLHGQWFDSTHEANRFFELLMLQKAKKITELKTQVPYELIPAQREPDMIGSRGGIKKGKCIEKSCVYYADFVYKNANGDVVVEDAKSPATRTEAYKIKKKLMLYRHGIRIVEV